MRFAAFFCCSFHNLQVASPPCAPPATPSWEGCLGRSASLESACAVAESAKKKNGKWLWLQHAAAMFYGRCFCKITANHPPTCEVTGVRFSLQWREEMSKFTRGERDSPLLFTSSPLFKVEARCSRNEGQGTRKEAQVVQKHRS